MRLTRAGGWAQLAERVEDRALPAPANIGITLDLYGHLLPGSEEEAATLLDAYLAREVDGSTVARTVAPTSQAAA